MKRYERHGMKGTDFRLREELADQMKALNEMKEMAASYGFDISVPAKNAKEAAQWLYFGYLAAIKTQNGAAMSVGRVSTFLDIYIERDLKAGVLTEKEAQELIDHMVMKFRMVKFARITSYTELFSGDPVWATLEVGGMGQDGGKLFEHMPGQCAMVCAPGVSEGMFSITSSPTNKEYQEFSIKKCGMLTDYLHSLQVGDEITVRGPYGNHFPVETELKGKNLLFIAGGIGLAPLRSVINYVLDNRENYGTVDILYGSRSADDLVQLKEIQEVWMKAEGVNVYLTIDREQEGWDGHVGFVPTYLKEIGFDTDKVALVCGPPIMIKFVLAGLQEMGFTKEQVYTTLELRMKCGVGKCGRCNIGSKYVCKDGPVFRFDEIDELPNEY